MIALPSWVQQGGIEATLQWLGDHRSGPASLGVVLRPPALSAEFDHDRHGRRSGLAMGRGPDRGRGGETGRLEPGEFVCQILLGARWP